MLGFTYIPFAKGTTRSLTTEQPEIWIERESRLNTIKNTSLANGSQNYDYQLQAAATFLQDKQLQKTQEILESIAPENLSPALTLRYRLLAAQLALAERNGKQALILVKDIKNLDLNLGQQTTLYSIRVEAYELEGDLLAAIRNRIQLESLLENTQALEENQRNLWYNLMSVSPDTLKAWQNQRALSNSFRGWLDLAQLFQRYQLQPSDLQQAIHEWQVRYPSHPAFLLLLRTGIFTLLTDPFQPATIALLLPAEKKFTAAVKAIRNGFFAAYYGDNSHWRPTIRYYSIKVDPTTNKSNIRSIYQRAQEEGAEFIVGPLTKESLTDLVEAKDLPIPTLALNYLENAYQPVEKLYQFTLSPEDEAKGMAERAWYDGHSNALTLVPNNLWGQRMKNALTQRWKQLGGKTLALQTYDPEEKDYSLLIQRLLNLDKRKFQDSKEFHQRLATLEPPQHLGADVIFLAAFPKQAQLLIPQLRFYRAENLPVYSSSHIYDGYLDPNQNLDLDGVIFSDMPWVLNQNSQRDPGYQSLAASYPEDFKHLKRLYALGYDSYRVIPYLNALHQIQGMTFEGATGKLRMDAEQRLQRNLIWARFKGGRFQLLNHETRN
ncbi:LppC family lipoprotein [Candidatus Nitrosoglobus terrae]|uniref:LppC family lipoprotein n=2 Tax=Candidatus Nitrosoglobus terrae TaxID=1630141 RepID=A0A1Q2SKC2_9GAMM|nr:LppC family lipoprotein [Candidatus Nitrosoglobus terrae]